MIAAQTFDAQKWKAQRGNPSHNNPRIGMVSGAKKLLRTGMTQDEVGALLGEPEGKSATRWQYDLGASPYGVDFEYLVIEFDEQGRVLRVSTIQG